jgi:hypothetical protein
MPFLGTDCALMMWLSPPGEAKFHCHEIEDFGIRNPEFEVSLLTPGTGRLMTLGKSFAIFESSFLPVAC